MDPFEISSDSEEEEQLDIISEQLINLRGRIPEKNWLILRADVEGENKRGFTKRWVEDTSQKLIEGEPQFEKQSAKDRKAGKPKVPLLNLPAGGYWRYDRKQEDEYQTKPSREGWGITDPLNEDGASTLFRHPKVFQTPEGELKRWIDFRKGKSNQHIPPELMAKKKDSKALEEANRYLQEKLLPPVREGGEPAGVFEGEKWRAIRKYEGGEVQRAMERYDEDIDYHDVQTGRVKLREMGWADLKQEPAKEYKRGGEFQPEKGEVRYRRKDQPKPEELDRMLKWLEPVGDVSNVHMAMETPLMNQRIKESGVSMSQAKRPAGDWKLQHIHERIEETGHWGQKQWEEAIASSSDAHMVHTAKINPANPSKRIKHPLGGGAVNLGVPGKIYVDEAEREWDIYMDSVYAEEQEKMGDWAIDLREVPIHIPELRGDDGQILHKAQSYPGVKYGQHLGPYETGQVIGDVIEAGGYVSDPGKKILHHGVWAEVEKVRQEIYDQKIKDVQEAKKLSDSMALVALNPAVASGQAVVQADGRAVNEDGVVYGANGRPTGEVIEPPKKKLGFEEWMRAEGNLDPDESLEDLDPEEVVEFREEWGEAGGIADDEVITTKAGGAEDTQFEDATGPDAGNRIFNIKTGLGAGRYKK